MTEKLSEENFAQHLNTKFRVNLDLPQPVELELVEVKSYRSKPEEQAGMERFSAYFYCPLQLPQGTYTLMHEQMGSQDIFLVPIGPDERGFRYEAVFNYYR